LFVHLTYCLFLKVIWFMSLVFLPRNKINIFKRCPLKFQSSEISERANMYSVYCAVQCTIHLCTTYFITVYSILCNVLYIYALLISLYPSIFKINGAPSLKFGQKNTETYLINLKHSHLNIRKFEVPHTVKSMCYKKYVK
jgi:hypothetical protein